MRAYSEHSGVEFEAWFESAQGVPTVPGTAHWRLRNLDYARTLQDWTEATPEIVSGSAGEITGVRVAIEVPGTLHVLQSRRNDREALELEVVADKGTAREYSESCEYYVRRRSARS